MFVRNDCKVSFHDMQELARQVFVSHLGDNSENVLIVRSIIFKELYCRVKLRIDGFCGTHFTASSDISTHIYIYIYLYVESIVNFDFNTGSISIFVVTPLLSTCIQIQLYTV